MADIVDPQHQYFVFASMLRKIGLLSDEDGGGTLGNSSAVCSKTGETTMREDKHLVI